MTQETKPDSAAAHPLALKMRRDLCIRPQFFRNRRYWCVKDPITLEYFHLQNEEYEILRLLDGAASLADIKRRFEHRFAPLQVTVEHLRSFVGALYQDGFVLTNTTGQGEILLKRHLQSRRRRRISAVAGILAFRFRGLDPQRFLTWLYKRVSWLFSPLCVAASFLILLGAVALVAIKFDTLLTQLPDFGAFFTARNVVLLAITLAGVKILHELGHGLTCIRFGGECHEIGIFFLVFVPCLFCNVSDSWMLEDKWKRIAISAAGIWVEIVIAALCTFIWFFTEPSLLKTICLNVMFICSINTLARNGNPLLRYDGYFVLSDLLEIPNLAQRSRSYVTRFFCRCCFGFETDEELSLQDEPRGALLLYGTASIVYRCLVVAAILWFCHKLFKSWGFEPVGQVIMVVVLSGMLFPSLLRILSAVRDPAIMNPIRKGRSLLAIGIMSILGWTLWSLPIPFHVDAVVVIRPKDAQNVFVPIGGSLLETVSAGDVVRRGQSLARLENVDLKMEIEKLSAERREMQLYLRGLEARRLHDPTVAAQIATAKEVLADVARQLEQRRDDAAKLILRAATDGIVLPPPFVSAHVAAHEELGYWSGTPMDRVNRRAYLETGTLFCSIGSPEELEAVLIVNEADIQFVRVGQRVRILLNELPGKILEGLVEEMATSNLTVVPAALSSGGELAMRSDSRGVPRPMQNSYAVRVSLEGVNPRLLRIRATGHARISADAQPLGTRLHRFLRRTFRFKF